MGLPKVCPLLPAAKATNARGCSMTSCQQFVLCSTKLRAAKACNLHPGGWDYSRCMSAQLKRLPAFERCSEDAELELPEYPVLACL